MEYIDMICQKCNAEIQDDMKFCSQCGESVVSNRHRKRKRNVITITAIVVVILVAAVTYVLNIPGVVLIRSAISTVGAIEKEVEHTLSTLPVVSHFENISTKPYTIELQQDKKTTTLYTDLNNQSWRIDNFLGSICITKDLITCENNLTTDTLGVQTKDLKDKMSESSLARGMFGDNIEVETSILDEKDREEVISQIKEIFLEESIHALKQIEITKLDRTDVELNEKVVKAKTYQVEMEKKVLETMLINIGNRVFGDPYIRSVLSQYEIIQSVILGEQGLGSSEEHWKEFIQSVLTNQDLSWNIKLYKGRIVEVKNSNVSIRLDSIKEPLQLLQIWTNGELTLEVQSYIEDKVYHFKLINKKKQYNINYQYEEINNNLEIRTKKSEKIYSVDASVGNKLVITNEKKTEFQMESIQGELPKGCFDQTMQYVNILEMDFYKDTLAYLLEMLYGLLNYGRS